MKRQDVSNLKTKNEGELLKMVADLRAQINRFSLELPLRRSKNTNMVKNLKKNVAQILSVLKEQSERK